MTTTPTPDAPARLLIVDDDPASIRLMSEVVKSFGDIRFATGGVRAVELARSWHPDLILLDAEMPDMDGFEVCTTIKADPATHDIAIIFVTAHSDTERETAALHAGAVDFINKPINPEVVRARAHTHITLKRQTDLLRRLAAMDGLTGIANRRMFDEVLANELRRARRAGTPLSLAMLDVDFFKPYNDHYGHQEGDHCLQQVAKVLQDQARRPTDFVARYGGEEFAIIQADTPPDASLHFAQTLCDAVRGLGIPHASSRACDVVTVSLGLACLVPDRKSVV